jgi:hypothetical protein
MRSRKARSGTAYLSLRSIRVSHFVEHGPHIGNDTAMAPEEENNGVGDSEDVEGEVQIRGTLRSLWHAHLRVLPHRMVAYRLGSV